MFSICLLIASKTPKVKRGDGDEDGVRVVDFLRGEMMLKELEGERERGGVGISREGLAASGLVGRHMLPAQRCRTASGSKKAAARPIEAYNGAASSSETPRLGRLCATAS